MSDKEAAQWAIVELFGHQRIAGRIGEHSMGGCSFVRVDVPAIAQGEGRPDIPALTKLYGNGAIYAISFVDEAMALLTATSLKVQPINAWELREALGAMEPGRVRQLGLRPLDGEARGEIDE